MQPLPAAPFEACDLRSGQVTSTSMVRYRGNDYSVPVAYGQVLRLLERFAMEDLHTAIKDALHKRAISFDAIKHLVLCRVEHRPPRLDLDVYPFLPRTNVATTSASAYMSLLSEGSAS